MKRLHNKTAAITGGGSGIGRAIARRFAAEGASVIILDFHEESAEMVRKEIVALGGLAEAGPCDVTDFQALETLFQRHDGTDILVNCAGIAHVGNLLNTLPKDFERLFAVNVKGTYMAMRAAVPHMLGRGAGVILNIASIASKVGLQDRFAYSMTKGAVLTMTLSVARDYIDKNIRCNCICPARIHTPFIDGFLEKNYPDHREETFEKLSKFQPIGRMGKPEEVAALAAFLCSEEASFITGSAYDIDGGVTTLR